MSWLWKKFNRTEWTFGTITVLTAVHERIDQLKDIMESLGISHTLFFCGLGGLLLIALLQDIFNFSFLGYLKFQLIMNPDKKMEYVFNIAMQMKELEKEVERLKSKPDKSLDDYKLLEKKKKELALVTQQFNYTPKHWRQKENSMSH